MPKRIQRKRTKGWKRPENTVYVGRGSYYGNPFVIGVHVRDAEEAVYHYKNWIESWKTLHIAKIRKELRGKNLMCWCPEHQKCHADILLKIANDPLYEIYTKNA